MKARYYKDRNPGLAKQAYLFALSFPSTKLFGKTHRLEEPHSPSSCGCSFVRCGIPQPVSSCWASSQSTHHTCSGGGGETLQKMTSAEAMSTAFTSGTMSRLHTDDLDELIVHNPVAHRLHLGDVSGRTSGKEEYGQLEDSDFRAEIHAELGQLHLMCGEPLEALECYKSASALAPDQLAYSYRRGVVLQQLGQREKAISCFRSVLQNDSTYKPAIFNLGICLAEDPATRAEALGTFEHLLSIDPNNDNVSLCQAFSTVMYCLRCVKPLGRVKPSCSLVLLSSSPSTGFKGCGTVALLISLKSRAALDVLSPNDAAASSPCLLYI